MRVSKTQAKPTGIKHSPLKKEKRRAGKGVDGLWAGKEEQGVRKQNDMEVFVKQQNVG